MHEQMSDFYPTSRNDEFCIFCIFKRNINAKR